MLMGRKSMATPSTSKGRTMKRPLFLLLTALCLLLPCAIIGKGASSLPMIQGTVVDPAGKPAMGATVLIVSRDKLTSAISDKSGKFSIELANPRRVFG